MESKKSLINSVSKAEKFVDRLLTKGIKIDCNETNFSNYELPPFYDEKLYKKGQEFFHKHIFSMFFAKFQGLLAILAVPEVLRILSMTKKSSTNYSAYVRYMSTIFHMLVWYRNDFKPGSNSWKSLSNVNKMHSSASKQGCNLGLNKISQKDMAITQFGFMGFQICRGKLIGIHNATDEELEGFIHIWRVVGYLMGMEDRFNICSGSINETREICNLLVDRCLYPAMSKKDPNYIKMSGHLIEGMWCMTPMLIYDVMMNYLWFLVQKIDDNNNNSKSILNKRYFEVNFFKTAQLYFMFYSMWLLRYNIFRLIYNFLKHLNLWFMENLPILAYYSFGTKTNVIVNIKL